MAEVRFLFPSLPPGGSNSYFKSVFLGVTVRNSFFQGAPTLLTYAPPHKCPCASSWGMSCMRGSLPRPPRQVGGTLLRVQESTRPPYYLPPYRL